MEAKSTIRKDRPESPRTFKLKKSLYIKNLISESGLSREEFVRLNPALRKPILDGKKPVPQGYLVRKPGPHEVKAARIVQNASPRLPRIKKQPSPSVTPPRKIAYIVQNVITSYSIHYTKLYEGLPSIVNLIASVLFFSLDQQRPHYLTGHPLTIPKMTLCTNSGFPLKKSPPRCRVSEMIKPNKLGGQCPSQLQGISSDFHHPTYRLPFS